MRLPLPWLLALRYLKSSRRDAYVSLLSTLATGGITLGVSALILVLSGLAGLQGVLREDVLSRTPHLEIELPPEADAASLAEDLQHIAGVLGTRRILRARGWLLAGGGAINVEMVGYEGSLPHFFPAAADTLGDEETTPGLYIGENLATRWGLRPLDTVELVSARPTLTPFGPQPRIRRIDLANTFQTGRTEAGSPRIALPLDTAEHLFGKRQIRLEVQAESHQAALELAPRLMPHLPEGSHLSTWADLNRGLFFALKLERLLMFISVFLIVPVAAMALVTVLALLISSKRSELGMLQAMGAHPAALRRAFLLLGLTLGVSGLTLGSFLGLGGAWFLDHFKVLTPPGDAYFIDYIPFRIMGRDLVAVLGATGLFTLLSTLYAARRAAPTRPVEALSR
jgi:lipoprotein-releasing system permease protein